MNYDILRNNNANYSRFLYEYNDFGRSIYEYDGGFLPDEDPADYLSHRMTIKAVKLA